MSPVFYTPHIPKARRCKLCGLWFHQDCEVGVCKSCWKSYKNQEYNRPSDYSTIRKDEEE